MAFGPGVADQPTDLRLARDVEPATSAATLDCRGNVTRMRTVVVLLAP